jgi:hypothetical protein|tara:strand:+ start:677 stop:1054 length:378 start_codon:yes stop_codon:yes gene_type:complete
LEPGGRVKSIPGLSARKRDVVTRRSVLVRTRPMAFATRENVRKKTRAWNMTAVLPVRPSLKATLEPSVLRRIPGLRAKKRAAGIATFWDVISGSMFVYNQLHIYLRSVFGVIKAKLDKFVVVCKF